MELILLVIVPVIGIVIYFASRKRSSGGSSNSDKPTGWVFQASPGLSAPTAYGDGGLTFDFPAVDGVHYLVKTPPAQALATLSARGTVLTTGTPYFDFRTNPNNQSGAPSSFRLYFQRQGDNMSGAGDYQYYRWWLKAGVELRDGAFQTTGSLSDPGSWSSVFGASGDASPEATAGFQAAAQNIGLVGLTFGGGSFYGHGVFVDPSTGTAAFRLEAFEAR